uniref:Zinc finger CCCH domain-containing protein 13-like n=1 Tax=Acanthochromis polyacanthus TaxID=80966 RepID=A0A3Q1GVH6_9TELE
MSVASLPEWKQLLLEKKRREEEERERREKEEEEKFASMPAWKRGIIQRRKMNEPSLSPDPALWLDAEPKPASQVSVETIVPVHENPFIRTQSAWRKGRDVEVGNEPEVKEREKDKMSPKGQDGESGRGRDIELKIERFRDLSEPREKERSVERSQGKEKTGQSGEGQDWEEGRGVERRDSWRIGKPLSRIESLREKIRQRELERQRQRDAQDGGEAAEINDAQEAEDRYEERGSETEKEWEAAAHVQRRQVEAERGQEDAVEQTVAADVKREVGVLKTCPQLPASQAVGAEEVNAASETTADSFQISDDEDDPLKHVEEQLRRHRGRHESREEHQAEEEEEEEEKELSEEEVEGFTSPLDKSLSPSPPHPNSLAQTITINPSLLRSQSPVNTLKPAESTPTPASSPSSPSPAQSPSISPSPSPSPTLFSIRRGGVTGSVVRPTTAGLTSVKTPVQQTTTAVVEPAKKKYPTVEEIEVIGGYQNLEKSCLIKNRGTPKRGKVCFDEDQLEQVCEYPSETFMLTFTSFPHELGRMEKLQGEDVQEEEGEVEAGPVVLKSTRSTGITTGPRLRVGQCHPLLKKHKV